MADENKKEFSFNNENLEDISESNKVIKIYSKKELDNSYSETNLPEKKSESNKDPQTQSEEVSGEHSLIFENTLANKILKHIGIDLEERKMKSNSEYIKNHEKEHDTLIERMEDNYERRMDLLEVTVSKIGENMMEISNLQNYLKQSKPHLQSSKDIKNKINEYDFDTLNKIMEEYDLSVKTTKNPSIEKLRAGVYTALMSYNNDIRKKQRRARLRLNILSKQNEALGPYALQINDKIDDSEIEIYKASDIFNEYMEPVKALEFERSMNKDTSAKTYNFLVDGSEKIKTIQEDYEVHKKYHNTNIDGIKMENDKNVHQQNKKLEEKESGKYDYFKKIEDEANQSQLATTNILNLLV